MPKESTPICFRVSDEDRVVLEAAAFHLNLSLSEFVRSTALGEAGAVMQASGDEEAVLQQYRDAQRRGEQFACRDKRI